MKKITLFSIFALSVFMLFGQSQRLTLIEHFTQASCPYCPPGNVHVDEIIENTARIISMGVATSLFPGISREQLELYAT